MWCCKTKSTFILVKRSAHLPLYKTCRNMYLVHRPAENKVLICITSFLCSTLWSKGILTMRCRQILCRRPNAQRPKRRAMECSFLDSCRSAELFFDLVLEKKRVLDEYYFVDKGLIVIEHFAISSLRTLQVLKTWRMFHVNFYLYCLFIQWNRLHHCCIVDLLVIWVNRSNLNSIIGSGLLMNKFMSINFSLLNIC